MHLLKPPNRQIDIQTEIFDSEASFNFLPIINAKIKGMELRCLLDSGSSVSLIDKDNFEEIKKHIPFKFSD